MNWRRLVATRIIIFLCASAVLVAGCGNSNTATRTTSLPSSSQNAAPRQNSYLTGIFSNNNVCFSFYQSGKVEVWTAIAYKVNKPPDYVGTYRMEGNNVYIHLPAGPQSTYYESKPVDYTYQLCQGQGGVALTDGKNYYPKR